MGGVGHARPDGASDIGVGVQNQNLRNEVKDGKDGEVQGVSEEEESKMNGIVQDLNDTGRGDIVPLGQGAGVQKHQQQVPGPIIRWERFLPVRTLKVLLVESDDSTRQVVSALLRNCSYEVAATANGLEAWKILEDLTNHIDLVLTEVVMPCLSGIGLLSKIMNHNNCKNIPVIMMSSNDSMGTVFKCLSKGAVDFLVKPIRKNELKNLWQHVWRRCHSSSGSGSESGTQTQKSVKSKSVDDSDNNSGSNDDDDDNGSTPLHARDGSDDGSGTQSSWTKRAVEIESPQRVSLDQLTDAPDSTCAQVIHAKPETSCNDWVDMSANEDCVEQKEPADDLMAKDLGIGVARNANVQFEVHSAEKICPKVANTNMDNLLGSIQNNDSVIGLEGKYALNEQKPPAADLIGAIASNSDMQQVDRIVQAPNRYSRAPEGKEKAADGSTDVLSLELSLKRLRSISDGGTATTDDRNVLRRSEQSAFSRYHTSAASYQAPTGYGGSSPLENSSEAIRPESMYNTVFSSSADPIKQGSNGCSNNNEMGSTAKNVFSKPITRREKIASPSTVKFSQTSSAFHPVQLQASTNQQVEKIDDKTTAATKDARGIQHQVQVQHHHHHHYHHHHVHVHNSQKQQQQPSSPHRDDSSLKNMAGDAAQCGSSNAFVAPVEGNAANYSINGSNSGSNHGNNGHNISSTTMKAGGTNVESASCIADQSGAGGDNGSGSGSASGVDQDRFAQREAALKRFREKRKERNFGKKVRYQSRKRLAEQRPRVRGQFVRQNVHEQTGRETDKSAS